MISSAYPNKSDDNNNKPYVQKLSYTEYSSTYNGLILILQLQSH